MTTKLTIGLIPDNWSANSDDGMRIDVGDAEFSKTKEIVFDSEDGSVVCFDQRMQWQFANRADYLELKKLVSNLK